MMNDEINNKNDVSSLSKPPKDLLTLVGNSNNSTSVNNDVITDLKDLTNVNDKKESINENKMNIEDLMKNVKSPKIELEKKTKKENKLFFAVAIVSGICFVFVLLVALLGKGKLFNFSGNTAYYQDKVIDEVGSYQTKVVTDNLYKGVKVNNDNDAKNLIVRDSTNQKNKCENKKVKEIEADIEKNYKIVAVNLCEISYDFALEIENVIKSIYSKYPTVKGYLTNLTITNTNEDYLASFSAAKLFAKSNTFNTYPNVYKMHIFLNANYFLNDSYFDAVIENASLSGWFISNATKTSIVAHEFGHYLAFVAQLKNDSDINSLILLTKKNNSSYRKLISNSNDNIYATTIVTEAYKNYNKKHNNEYYTVEAYYSSISEYASVNTAEAIAEAFHDYYVNGDEAKEESKEIMNVLNKKLKG